jgi:hypothetical protein
MDQHESIGIDLACEPHDTALCKIIWGERNPKVQIIPDLGLKGIEKEIEGKMPVGIDAPFGWPLEFVNAMARSGRGENWQDACFPPEFIARVNAIRPIPEMDGPRHAFHYRRTDLVTWASTGQQPMRVSASLIGSLAMHAAALLAIIAPKDLPRVRLGQTRIVEVYPAAALAVWRNKHEARRETLDRIIRKLELDFDKDGDRLRCLYEKKKHAGDALLAAIVARAHGKGLCQETVWKGFEKFAETEGWIAIPPPLSALLPGPETHD